jgi:hypothetical protein
MYRKLPNSASKTNFSPLQSKALPSILNSMQKLIKTIIKPLKKPLTSTTPTLKKKKNPHNFSMNSNKQKTLC